MWWYYNQGIVGMCEKKHGLKVALGTDAETIVKHYNELWYV